MQSDWHHEANEKKVLRCISSAGSILKYKTYVIQKGPKYEGRRRKETTNIVSQIKSGSMHSQYGSSTGFPTLEFFMALLI